MKRKALGKGLRSLIPETPPPKPRATAGPAPAQETAPEIDLDRIVPNRNQPRERFDPQKLEELAGSLKRDGVLQPVVVRPLPGGEFELIAGERRWRAAQAAGLLKIPAIVKEVDDNRLLELALIENVQREQLNPLEEANAYQTLINDLGLTQQQVADRVGKQRTTVTNFLRLLNLVPEVQELIGEGLLSAGHAKALAGVTSREAQIDLAQRTVREGLTVRQLEALASGKGGRTSGRAARKSRPRDPNLAAAEERLQSAIGTRVRIVQARSGRGRLELHFFSEEELQRVYQLVLKATRAGS